MLQAVIMAGGFGTRLKPLTNNMPKPMVPVVNVPMMEHLINLLKLHGITEYVILLYYQPDIIKNYFGDGSRFGVKIDYVLPDRDYGTAGAVRLSEPFINDDFLVISGDVLTDFDLTAFHKFHIEKKSLATISLFSSENPLQYGIILTNNDGRIVRFMEKPSSSEVFSDTINTGIYYFGKDIFQHIPEGENFDFSKDLFPLLLKNEIPVYGYKSTGYWKDVGNLDEYIYANMDVLEGKLNYIKAKDEFGNCLSKGAVIEKGAVVENSILAEGVTIHKGAVVKHSVIWKNTKISSKTSVLFDVIGENCTVGESGRINDFVFIGDNCKIGKNVFISSSIKIWDRKKIRNNSKVTKSLIYEDSFFTELFTDSRITGLSNLQINPEFGAKLGTSYGTFLGKNKTVMAGRDMDDISLMEKRTITSGLLSAGVNVIDLQVIPIPILRQELKNEGGAGGFFVRKSPFEKNKTDIIFFDKDGKDLSSSKTKSIERLFFGEEYRRVDYADVGVLRYAERTNIKYKEHFLKCLNTDIIKKRKFKLVIDYSHGIASTIFPNILGEFNCDIVSLSAHLEKDKLTRELNEFKSATKNFSFVVKSLNYDLGFMIDAGAEKIWMAAGGGKVLSGDRFCSIVTKMFLMANPGVKKIAMPVQATREVDLIAKDYGVEVLRVKDSHYAMMIACDDPEVKFVGGTRGGFLFPQFLYATDGMYTIAKILELIAFTNTDIGELDKTLPKLYLLKENIDCSKEEKGLIMRKFMEDTVEYKQELIDGVRIFLSETDSVFCIPDKNRDLVHLDVETDSYRKSEKLMREYRKKIEQTIQIK
jgi:mannose-1-phosphate guanylyltransferase/phosphomannomutase